MSGDARPDRLGWFDELYRNAGEDPDKVPWARLAPHPGLVHGLDTISEHRGRAIDVGCGLGDNAEYLSDLGFETTAFDLSTTAVEWARRRFPATTVTYEAADLFDLPNRWRAQFDLVSEVYTLQSLPEDIRSNALHRIAKLAAENGRIVVVCMARNDDEQVDGPPWPLARREIDALLDNGFSRESFDDLPLGEHGRRHFVAVYRRIHKASFHGPEGAST